MGKEKKFTTEVLLDIIHKFYQDKKDFGVKMNFSNLARYAKEELHIAEIDYYHFSRNQEIKAKVKEYNETLKSGVIAYSNDNSYFANLNVKEFVKSNITNEERLIFYLTNLQEIQKGLYDRTITSEFKVKELEQKLKEETSNVEKYKRKYKELKIENENMKQELKVYKDALRLGEENQLIDALNSTGLYIVEREEVSEEKQKKESIERLDDTNGKNIETLITQYQDILE